MRATLLSIGLLISIFFLQSFAPATPYKIGDAVVDFSLKNVNGKMLSMADYPNTKGFIIVFTCNHCPYAKAYQERVEALNKMYAPKGFPVLAINPNDKNIEPGDSYENMQKRAKEMRYSYPYLYDETQQVAKAFGAVRTPHVFVVMRENNRLVLKYIGGIDDNTEEPEKATHRYVEEAVNALLAGQPVAMPQTKAIGCGIKWKS